MMRSYTFIDKIPCWDTVLKDGKSIWDLIRRWYKKKGTIITDCNPLSPTTYLCLYLILFRTITMHCLMWDGSHADFTWEWQWHGQNFELHPKLIKGCPKSFEGLSYDAVLLFFGKQLFCPKQSTCLLWHRLYLACKTSVSFFFICLNWKMNGGMYSELLVQYWKILALNMNEIIHQEKNVPNILLHF